MLYKELVPSKTTSSCTFAGGNRCSATRVCRHRTSLKFKVGMLFESRLAPRKISFLSFASICSNRTCGSLLHSWRTRLLVLGPGRVWSEQVHGSDHYKDYWLKTTCSDSSDGSEQLEKVIVCAVRLKFSRWRTRNDISRRGSREAGTHAG